MPELVNLRAVLKENLIKAESCEQAGCLIQAADLYEAIIDQISDLMYIERVPSRLHIYQRHLDRIHERLNELHMQFDYHNRHGYIMDNQIIPEGSTNMSYERIYGKYLTNGVKEILIYEPYFSKRCHMKNFMHFMELVVRKCQNLCYVRLTTIQANSNIDACQQRTAIVNIRCCLLRKNIDFHYRFVDSFDTHIVVLNTGYIIRNNNGLNYYQATVTPFILGICDYDFRKCRETLITVWRTCHYAKNTMSQKKVQIVGV